jgi:hypothetical protein
MRLSAAERFSEALWIEDPPHALQAQVLEGCLALFALMITRERDIEGPGAGLAAGTWRIWSGLTALVFRAVDWRMTKHLVTLPLPPHGARGVWGEPRGLL